MTRPQSEWSRVSDPRPKLAGKAAGVAGRPSATRRGPSQPRASRRVGAAARPEASREARAEIEPAPRARPRLMEPLAHLVERVDQAPPVGAVGDPRPGRFEHLREVRPAEVRHAEQPEAGLRVVVDRVDRDDVGVLEPGEHLRLVPLGPRDLQRDRAVAQLDLLGQVHPGERPPAQLA